MQNSNNSKKICILGATGFIGKNLLNKLQNSYAVSVREKNWCERVSTSNVIINLIGKAHDHKGTANEKDYNIANVDLVKEIYREFINSSASLFIHISSLAAVEEYKSSIYLEENDECHPSSLYGKSKRKAELWLLKQNLPKGKKVIILRPPMVHGPGDKGNLGLLYKLISKGVPYPLSSYNNKRSFLSIANFNFFINEIILKEDFINAGIYHIADDEPLETKEIIQIIKRITNKNIPDFALPKVLVNMVAKFGDIIPIPLNSKRLKKMTSDLLVSNKKIKGMLGIDKLPLSSKEGLELTIKSFKQSN